MSSIVTEDLVHYMNMGIALRGYNFLLEEPEWAVEFAPNGKMKQPLSDIFYREPLFI